MWLAAAAYGVNGVSEISTLVHQVCEKSENGYRLNA
jgi:hypothetical protein